MTEKRNLLMVGGGIISLSIAVELALKGEAVTILCRDAAQAATHAAAGMLAPQAEQIPPSPMLELCLRSRSLYAEWSRKIEAIAGVDAGYWASGILAPSYHAQEVSETWLDRDAIHRHQAGLGAEVLGGHWYPDDAQVDNRALAKALWIAAQELGVEIKTGITVDRIAHDQRNVTHLETNQGNWQADRYVLATGAWSQALLPVPIFPRKGQLFSVKVPDELGQPLRHVLFGEEIYIVPRQDGRIVVGATSEDVSFLLGNTPDGMQQLLSAAIRLYPAIATFLVQEFWWGFRPATADECPLLGDSPYENLTIAIGHYRNGILLAPITGTLIAESILTQQRDRLLAHFHWSRFTK